MAAIVRDQGKLGPGAIPVWFDCLSRVVCPIDEMITPMGSILSWCVDNLDGLVYFELDPFSNNDEHYGTKYVLWFSDENAAFAFKMRWK
jgi:hypothetical protein